MKFAKVIKTVNPDGRLFVFTRKMDEGKYKIEPEKKQYYIYASNAKLPALKGKHDVRGTLKLDLMSGDAEDVTEFIENRKDISLYVHAAFNFTAWILLVPIGILLARSKWLFPSERRKQQQSQFKTEYQSLKNHKKIPAWWFHSHWIINGLASMLSFSGIILAFTEFNLQSPGVLNTHKTLSCLVLALLIIQVGWAMIRPHCPEKGEGRNWLRFWWEMQHLYGGRITALVGIACVITGILSLPQIHHGGYLDWIWALIAILIPYSICYLILEVVRFVTQKKNYKQEMGIQNEPSVMEKLGRNISKSTSNSGLNSSNRNLSQRALLAW